MLTLEDVSPPFALRISCGPVELAVLRDDDLPELVELGAVQCESGDVVGNLASAAVSHEVGYRDDGRRRIVQRTKQGRVGVDEQRVTVTPEELLRPQDEVAVEGAEGLRRFFGIDRGAA